MHRTWKSIGPTACAIVLIPIGVAAAVAPTEEYSKLSGPPRAWQLAVPATPYSLINMAHGNVFTSLPLFHRDGQVPLGVVLFHNSMAAASKMTAAAASGISIGQGWTMSYIGSIVRVDSDTVHVIADDGTTDVFIKKNDVWEPQTGVYDRLVENVGSNWLVVHKSRSYRRFDYLHGRLLAVGDSSGNELQIQYDSQDRLARVADPSGRELIYGYAATSTRLLTIAYHPDPDNEYTFEFADYGDTLDYVIALNGSNPSSTSRFWFMTYSQSGRIESFEDSDGEVWTIEGETDAFDVIDPPPSVGSPLVRSFDFSFLEEEGSRQHRIIDRRGQPWLFEFTNPQDPVERALTHTIDPLGYGPYFQYDGAMNVSDSTNALGGSPGATNYTSHYTWDNRGNLLTATDPLGTQMRLEYDLTNGLNNLRKVFLPDDAGQVSSEPAIEIQYSDANNPSRATSVIKQPALDGMDPSVANLEWYGPTDAGSCGSEQCPQGAWNGLLKRITDGNGVTQDYTYNCSGQPCTETEAAGSLSPRSRWRGYSPTGLPDSAGTGTTPGSGTTENIVEIKRRSSGCFVSGGCGTELAALGQGPSTACVPFSGFQEPQGCGSFSVSKEGLLTETHETCLIDPAGFTFQHAHSYEYNELRMLTAESFDMYCEPYLYEPPPVPQPCGFIRRVEHNYDLANGTYSRTKPNSTEIDLAMQADVRGLPQTVTRNGVIATFEYDPDGAVRSVTYSNGPRVEYTYDYNRRPTVVLHSRSIGSSQFVPLLESQYSYYPNGLVQSIEDRFFEPASTTPTEIAIQTRFFDYDNHGQLIQELLFTGLVGSSSALDDFPSGFGKELNYSISYSYDAGGNRLTKTVADGFSWNQVSEYTEYSYDVSQQSASSKANRLMSYQVYDAPNGQPIRSAEYDYDDDGNVSQVVHHGSGSPHYYATVFSYKDRKLLWLAIDERRTIEGTEVVCVRTNVREFRYDGSGQLYMTQTCDPDPAHIPDLMPNGDAKWTEFYATVPARDISIGIDRTEPNDPTVVATNISLQEPGAWVHNSGSAQTRFCHPEHGGSTRLETSGNGQILQFASYTAFGESVPELTSPDPALSRYGYGGGWGYEAPAGGGFPYLHLGARWYDPESGRFLQRDPIGINGGLNTYAYVRNMPVGLVDPSGMGFWDGSDWAIHEYVARKFWLLHPDSYLQSPMATIEALGISICGGWVAGELVYYGGIAAWEATGGTWLNAGFSEGSFTWMSAEGWVTANQFSTIPWAHIPSWLTSVSLPIRSLSGVLGPFVPVNFGSNCPCLIGTVMQVVNGWR